jgi:VanZ family protein
VKPLILAFQRAGAPVQPHNDACPLPPNCCTPQLRRRWRWLLLLMLATTSWLAFMPSEPKPDTAPQLDKLEHIVAFAALAFVAGLGGAAAARPCGWALPLLAYGLFIEVVQSWLPSRHADVLDLVADAAGIACWAFCCSAAAPTLAAPCPPWPLIAGPTLSFGCLGAVAHDMSYPPRRLPP